MKTLHIQTSAELRYAKNMMSYSMLVIFISSLFCLVVPQLIGFVLFVTSVAIFCYLFGVYRFSQLTYSPLFRYFLYIFGLMSFMLFLCLVDLFHYLPNPLIVSLIYGLAMAILLIIVVWLWYKIALEFEKRTSLTHFMVSFKCYVCSLAFFFLGMIALFLGIDVAALLLFVQDNDWVVYKDAADRFVVNRVALWIGSFSMMFYCIAGILSFVFALFGTFKITSASILDT